ncbi:hypothetical protein ACFVJK_30360 [Streptomyces sp. NPDC127172]|uniref:hypothetical protein n=1 Tax=Streptomyces sp. NPDC127172 TaxID=3345382 RepID=UPI00363355F4
MRNARQVESRGVPDALFGQRRLVTVVVERRVVDDPLRLVVVHRFVFRDVEPCTVPVWWWCSCTTTTDEPGVPDA